MTMPKINVYLSDRLAERVRASGVAVSWVCQQALRQAIERQEMSQDSDDPLLGVSDSVGAAFTHAGWTPLKHVAIAEVINADGRKLLVGTASPETSTWDLIGMLYHELQLVLRNVDDIETLN